MNTTIENGKITETMLGKEDHGMTGAESIPVIKAAMEQLDDDVSGNYWEATEGNAKKALAGLLAFAQMRPDGIWKGD